MTIVRKTALVNKDELEALNEELARHRAAVAVARVKGEHYPVCSYSRIKDKPCDCWKAQMEAALRGEGVLL